MAIDDPQPSAVVLPTVAVTDGVSSLDGVAPAVVGDGALKVATARLIEAGARVVSGRVFLCLLALTWVVLLFGAERVAGWVEATGSGGIARFFGVSYP